MHICLLVYKTQYIIERALLINRELTIRKKKFIEGYKSSGKQLATHHVQNIDKVPIINNALESS